MLESIYGMKGGSSDALGAYLRRRGGNPVSDVLNSAQVASGAARPQVDQAGRFGYGTTGDPSLKPEDVLGSFANYNAMTGPPLPGSAGFGADKAADQSKTGGAGPDLSHLNFDYSSDPVLMKMQAGGQRDTGELEQQAVDARRSLALQYGDKGFASSILDPNDPTLGAVSDDPDKSTSTLARLKRAYAGTVKANEDTMNENNLFYGGYRGKRLGDLAKDEQTQEADASSGAQAALGQIGAALSGGKRQIEDRETQAESDAANRKIQQLLAEIAAGAGASAGDNGGTGGTDTTTPPPPPDDGTGGSADTGATDTGGDLYFDPEFRQWVARNSSAKVIQ